MPGELSKLKAALAAWIAEKPGERRGKLLTDEEAREIARRAKELQRTIAAGEQKFEHFT